VALFHENILTVKQIVSSHYACGSYFLPEEESNQRSLVEFVSHKHIRYRTCPKSRDLDLCFIQIAGLESHTDHPPANPDEFDTLLQLLTLLPEESLVLVSVRRTPKSPGGVRELFSCAFVSPVGLIPIFRRNTGVRSGSFTCAF
jgi:hypothetical protein